MSRLLLILTALLFAIPAAAEEYEKGPNGVSCSTSPASTPNY